MDENEIIAKINLLENKYSVLEEQYLELKTEIQKLTITDTMGR